VEKTILSLDRKQAIWLTGHSLGGALALLCGYRLQPLLQRHNEQARTSGKHDQLLGSVFGVYTVGQPRCGNREFAEEVERRLPGKIFRTINNRDIVPRVPTRTMGYRHAGSVRYIDEFGKLHTDPGLWFRLLDTLLVSPDDLNDRATETVKDHSVDEYVAHLRDATALP
jgi:predicted lipase